MNESEMTTDQQANFERKNWPLLYKVLDHIKEHPAEWDQTAWALVQPDTETGSNIQIDLGDRQISCGTSFCFAGHAMMMTHPGAQLHLSRQDLVDIINGEAFDFSYVEVDGVLLSIQDEAVKELGLTPNEACLLFDANNSLARIEWILEQWDKGLQATTEEFLRR